MEMIFCQSCGMPLQAPEHFGTNKDDSANHEYCCYCYKNGVFTQDCTMDEMIEISLRHMKELFKDNPDFGKKEALNKMQSFFPQLKRWKK